MAALQCGSTFKGIDKCQVGCACSQHMRSQTKALQNICSWTESHAEAGNYETVSYPEDLH